MIRVTRRKLADIEEKVVDMDLEMRRATCCLKAEIKKMKAEAYGCLYRERKKVKYECHLRKIHTSVAERLIGASRDLRMCLCINWQE